jgi:hypothetical protein
MKSPKDKTKRIDLRASDADQEILRAAAAKLGAKNLSKTILTSVENFINAELETFFVNRPALKQCDLNIEKGRAGLQLFIDVFYEACGKLLTLTEAQSLFSMSVKRWGVADKNAIKELVITKLLEGKSTVIGGIELSETKLRELVILPNLEPLFEASDAVFNVPWVNYKEQFYWHAYQIQDNQVSIIPGEVEKVKAQFRCTAETPHQLQKLAKAKKLCQDLNAILDGEVFSPTKLEIPGLCYYDSESKKYEPSENYVLYGLQETQVFKR